MKRLITLLALLYFGSASAKTFQYLYLEANEGTASGGHVAVQFDDEVFHYQYANGLTRLTKDSRDSFEFDYRFLQNRGLHVADIAVSDAQFAVLQDSFKSQYWNQQRQFKQLQSFKNDQWLLARFLSINPTEPAGVFENSLSLSGAGLFYSEADFSATTPQPIGLCNTQPAASRIVNQLQHRLQARYGAEFLNDRRQTITDSIRQLSLADTEAIYRQQHYSVSERYADAINQLLALRVITDGKALQPNVCHSFNQPEWRLNSDQLNTLQNYQQRLLSNTISLLDSKRPDWGQALFVALARLVVIQQSLDSGHWVFLDDFADDAETINSNDYPNQAEAINRQRILAERHWQTYWQQLNDNQTLSDVFYTDLERAANRHQQWQNSLMQQHFRFHGQQALPIKKLPLPLIIKPDVSATQLQTNLTVLQQLIPSLSGELEQHYDYQLLTRNCVTELSANLNQALANQHPIDLISPDLEFVPFIAFANLENHYAVTTIHHLPSYRQQQLNEQYAQDFPPWVFVRESNILSAELYQYNPDDAAFLFFTDDSLLLRPMFGAFNTLTGLGQSLLGLLAWPTDNGKRLNNGTRGVLMSLPELAFINIRKGSYKFAVADTLQPLTEPGS
ncbi:MAG: hypothetical protein CTY19_11815 [Methylomonas sp.]|nr:MAG: hypothetical protein CTY19_11815 [Methylomonas sp.]